MELHAGLAINAQGHLEIQGLDTVDLAQTYGTPLYVMDEPFIRNQCRAFVRSIKKYSKGGWIAYAGKAFPAVAMCKIIQQEGMHLDVASLGELKVAEKAGFPMERVEFHGSNKSVEEMDLAIGLGVGRIIIDNLEEIQPLAQRLDKAGKGQKVLLRINPGIEGHTHEYIQTAVSDSKFGEGVKNGRAMKAIRGILEHPCFELVGIHFHIGSNLADTQCFVEGCNVMAEFAKAVHDQHGLWLKEFNLGGGFGAPYRSGEVFPAVEEVVQEIAMTLEAAVKRVGMPAPHMVLEPGRAIVAQAGLELYTVGTVKTLPDIRTYVSVDGGLMDNPRPGMYQAVYECKLANRMNEPVTEESYRISGMSCESDTLIEQIRLPEPKRGDILAVFTAGAYQYAMAGNYLRTPKPAVVMVNEGKSALMIKRQTYEQLLEMDQVPEWIG